MLTQNNLTQERKLKLRWFVTLSTLPLLGVVTAFGIVPQTSFDNVSQKTVVEEVALPRLAQAVDSSATYWHSEQVQRGDTVDEILRRLNVQDAAASDFLRKDMAAESLRQLAVGREVQAITRADGSLQTLRFINNSGSQISIGEDPGGFQVSELPPQIEQRVMVRTGEINSSLYAATDEADLPDEVASQLIDVFGGEIDFHRDLRKGDKFTVTYEMTYSNGEPLRPGRIQAAEFTNQGKSYRAVYFQADSKHGDYYSRKAKVCVRRFCDPRWNSPAFLPVLLPSAFIQSCRNGVHIREWIMQRRSAPKSKSRRMEWFPMLVSKPAMAMSSWSNIRAAIPPCTAICPASQKVCIEVKRVSQGDVIGYVGMTGWATGPHLHYEFRINGQQHDPLQVALPSAAPISPIQQAAFQEAASAWSSGWTCCTITNLALLD